MSNMGNPKMITEENSKRKFISPSNDIWVAITRPNSKLPASPMKIFAGEMLWGKKPKIPPMRARLIIMIDTVCIPPSAYDVL